MVSDAGKTDGEFRSRGPSFKVRLNHKMVSGDRGITEKTDFSRVGLFCQENVFGHTLAVFIPHEFNGDWNEAVPIEHMENPDFISEYTDGKISDAVFSLASHLFDATRPLTHNMLVPVSDALQHEMYHFNLGNPNFIDSVSFL